MVPGPGLGWPGPERGPDYIPRRMNYVCGNTYQEGRPANPEVICACGTFAVGRCVDCAKPVCGWHSTLFGGGQRVCSQDAVIREETASKVRSAAEAERKRLDAEAAAAARQRALEEDTRAREALRHGWSQWHQRATECLARMDDPIARLLTLVRFVVNASAPGPNQAAADLWESVLPWTLSTRLIDVADDPPWPSDEIADWFAQQASETASTVTYERIHQGLLRQRVEHVHGTGWHFQRGGARRLSGEVADVVVLASGEMVRAHHPFVDGRATWDRLLLNGHALCEMARLVGVAELPAPPDGSPAG